MKLYTKIAGTLALPLALAVAANSAQAYTVVDTSEHKLAIGGYVSAIASWSKTGDSRSAVNDKFNSDFDAGNSRINVSYTNKEIGTTFFWEQRLQNSTLRHAYFATEDGWVGGHTWSFGTNLVALAETIDTTGNSLVSYQVYAPRNLLLGKKFKLDDSMSFGVSIEGQNSSKSERTDDNGKKSSARAQKSPAPAVTANFEGNFSGIKVFTAVTNYAVNKKSVNSGALGDPKQSGKDKRFTRFTVGTAIPMGDATLKLGLTHNHGATHKKLGTLPSGTLKADNPDKLDTAAYSADLAKGTHASAALTYRINEKLRTNFAIETSKWDKNAISKYTPAKNGTGTTKNKSGKASRLWVNAFYQADNGIEWGAEMQYARVRAHNGVNDRVDGLAYGSGETHEGMLADKGTAFRVQAKYAF
ncbi:MAG: hypothetical protein M0Q29_01760 [Thiopseudomonas sp.]|nr:hypothetical protein [Thiopseudomonas sp.]MCK9464594.1 hypothetical protein [Thiopseudomonas sp.]